MYNSTRAWKLDEKDKKCSELFVSKTPFPWSVNVCLVQLKYYFHGRILVMDKLLSQMMMQI